jgi:hypothetical protein
MIEDLVSTEEKKDRPCEICEHYRKDYKGNYSCEKWECEYEEIDEVKRYE